MPEHVLPYARPEYQRDEARLVAANRRIGSILAAHTDIECTMLNANQQHTLDIDLFLDNISPALEVAGIDIGSDYGFPVAAMQPVPTETFVFTDRYVSLATTERSPDVPQVTSLHPGVSILRVLHEARAGRRLGAELLHSLSIMDQGEIFLCHSCHSESNDPRDISLRMQVFPEMYAHYEPSAAVLRFTTAKDVRFFTGTDQ